MKLRLVFALGAFALQAACGGRSEETATVVPEATTAETEQATASEPAPAAAPEAAPVVFDLSQIATSTATLGDFPFIAVPTGYEVYEEKTLDLAAFPIWTGSDFLIVEGRVYMAQSKTPDGKTYSRVEFERAIENAVKAAGGVRIVRGEVPNPTLNDLPNDLQQDTRLGMGNVYGNPFASYVIRRADRTIWIQTVSDANVANWAVIEAPLAAPAAQ